MIKKNADKKWFCIAGPIDPEVHYFIPKRLDWNLLDSLIAKREYFILHAPRQSGKTTAINEFVVHLNGDSSYNALYINIEPAQAMRDNIEKALITIVNIIKTRIEQEHKDNQSLISLFDKMLKQTPITGDFLLEALQLWAETSQKKIVLFIDEIDSLIGDSLLSVLRQIRSGFAQRPDHFPQSICLIGLRDVRDYKVWTKEHGTYVSTSSPFNIKAESLTLSNFTPNQVKDLYLQHTEYTAQLFTNEAIEYAYYLTQGQPWLVNALAYQACFRDIINRKDSITKEVIAKAKEQLIIRRDTHIDSLFDKLNDPRVRVIIDAIISGKDEITFNTDDVQYVRDLGIIKPKEFAIANPIYQEIIPRTITATLQEAISTKSAWYIDNDGNLNMSKLLEAFTQFFREHSQALPEYRESMPHLLLMAFLQRIINGGGTILREYALGRKRVDLVILWKKQKFVIEMKIRYSEDTLAKGLEQTSDYADVYKPNEAHLIIFDRKTEKTWQEKISNEIVTFKSQKIHVWTM